MVTTTKRWYVIHTQTGQEEKVKASLENRRQMYNMQEQISPAGAGSDRESF